MFRRRFAGMLAATLVMGAAVFALVELLGPWFASTSGFVAQAASLLALVGVGLGVYVGAAHLLGAAHFRELIRA
jgi:hypothetical protein